MLNGALDLACTMVTINVEHLAGLQEIGVLKLVTVCFIKKRPSVRVVIDLWVA